MHGSRSCVHEPSREPFIELQLFNMLQLQGEDQGDPSCRHSSDIPQISLNMVIFDRNKDDYEENNYISVIHLCGYQILDLLSIFEVLFSR